MSISRFLFITSLTFLSVLFACNSLVFSAGASQGKLPRLKISDNKRFIVQEDGSPFFYLADTAWELIHRLNREEADLYLTTRAKQGFTVIQAVALAEIDGLKDPNPYWHRPLVNDDPTKPNEEYFKHVDYIINKAASLGLYMGLLPTWGDKVNREWGGGPEIFTPENAAVYGEFLGRRYKDKPIIWILGGDRPIKTERHKQIWRAMAAGIKKGEGDQHHLMTYHIQGGQSTHDYLHDEAWMDFNMCQSGHGRRSTPNYNMIAAAYAKQPIKPCMDSESCYEDHPINWDASNGYFDEHDVRKLIYWGLFSGAHGVTYGCQDVWQMWAPPRNPIAWARTPWPMAINLPAANQMKYVKALVLSRPYLTRVPDQAVLADDRGEDLYHIQACRSSDGSYAFIYTPNLKPFKVNLNRLPASKLKAWWFNPRNGKATLIGEMDNQGTKEFTPPSGPNPYNDWVLVIDDAARNFPAPGANTK